MNYYSLESRAVLRVTLLMMLILRRLLLVHRILAFHIPGLILLRAALGIVVVVWDLLRLKLLPVDGRGVVHLCLRLSLRLRLIAKLLRICGLLSMVHPVDLQLKLSSRRRAKVRRMGL